MANIDTVTTAGAVLGAALVHLRTVKGMKQAELAFEMGLSASTWSRIEKGESGLSIDQLRQVAKVLGVTPGFILDMQEKGVEEAVNQGLRVADGTLSGAAASSAGLAALGGSLAAGGLGMAVGTAVAPLVPVFGGLLLGIIAAAFRR